MQQARVAAGDHHVVALLKGPVDGLAGPGDGAEQLSRRPHLALGALDQVGHRRLPEPEHVADAGGNVARPQKQHVDAVDGGDLRDIADRLFRLDLAGDQQVVGHGVEIILQASPPAGAAGGVGRDATHTDRRIAAGGDGGLGLGGVLHIGHDDAHDTDIQCALDVDHVVPRHPHHRRRPGSGRRLHQADCVQEIARSVLVVDDHGVVTGVGDDLGGDGAPHREPGGERGLAREHLLLAAIFEGHGGGSRWRGRRNVRGGRRTPP